MARIKVVSIADTGDPPLGVQAGNIVSKDDSSPGQISGVIRIDGSFDRLVIDQTNGVADERDMMRLTLAVDFTP